MTFKFQGIYLSSYELLGSVSLDAFIRNLFFNSNVMCATVADFMDIFSIFTVHPTDRRCGQKIKRYSVFLAVALFANRYMAYFMSRIIKDPKFNKFAPSLVAAAIVFCGREYLQLTPAWPFVLQQITSYGQQEMSECYEMLKRTINEDIITNFIENPSRVIHLSCCRAVFSPLSVQSSAHREDSEWSGDSECLL